MSLHPSCGIGSGTPRDPRTRCLTWDGSSSRGGRSNRSLGCQPGSVHSFHTHRLVPGTPARRLGAAIRVPTRTGMQISPGQAVPELRVSAPPERPQEAGDKIAPAIKDAEKACADGTSQDCAAAWDTVEELSAAAAHSKANAKVRCEAAGHLGTPLEGSRSASAIARSCEQGRVLGCMVPQLWCGWHPGCPMLPRRGAAAHLFWMMCLWDACYPTLITRGRPATALISRPAAPADDTRALFPALQADPAASDPLEQFCAKDPSADECRVYED